jgi:hypothetical protein
MTGQNAPDKPKRSLAEYLARIEAAPDPERERLRLTVERATAKHPELGRAIRYCALPRRITSEIIGVMRDAPLDTETNDYLLAELITHSFVQERRDGGYVYHDTIRDLLFSEWREPASRPEFDRHNEVLSKYFDDQHREVRRDDEYWGEVGDIVRQANPERYRRIVSRMESRLLEPLIESLYHATLQSADKGRELLSDRCFEYEASGQITICESLVNVLKGYFKQLPEADRDELALRWLRYWEARITRQLRRFPEAEAICHELLNADGGDVKLRLWTLDTLVNTLRDQDKLIEAGKWQDELLVLALETRQDTYNLPLWYERAASLNWTLDELPRATEHYRRAIATAREGGNAGQEAYSMLDLSGVLQDQGQWDQSFETALAARRFLFRHQLHTDRWLPLSMSIRLGSLMAFRDPRLLDTFQAQALALSQKVEDESQSLSRRIEYANLLRRGGQEARAERQLSEIERVAGASAPETQRLDLLLRRALAWEDQGDQAKAIARYSEMIALSEDKPGLEWYYGAALHNRGAGYVSCGQLEAAREDLRLAHAVWLRTGRRVLAAYCRVSAADLSRRRGRLDRAQRDLDQARPRLAATNPVYRASHHRVQAMVHRDRSEWVKAGEEFEKAARLHESLEDFAGAARDWTSLAEAAAQTGDVDRAAEYAANAQARWRQLASNNRYTPSDAAIEADEANAQGACDLHAWRDAEDRRESLTRACASFEQAIGLVGDNPVYHLNLADARAELEDWAAAARAVESALECAPPWMRSPALHEIAAGYYLQHLQGGESPSENANQPEAAAVLSFARKHLEAAQTMPRGDAGEFVDGWIRLGDGTLKLGEAEPAGEIYARGLAIAEAGPDGAQRASLHARLGFLAAIRDDRAGLARHFGQYLSEKNDATAFVADCGALIAEPGHYRKLKAAIEALRESQADPAVRRSLLDARFELIRSHHAPMGPGNEEFALSVTPVVIEGDARIFPEGDHWWESHDLFTRYIPKMRDRIRTETGVHVPGVRVRANESGLPPYAYIFMLNEVPIVMHTLQPDRMFCPDGSVIEPVFDAEALRALDWDSSLGRGYWVPKALAPQIESAGGRLWDPFEFLIRHLERLLRSNLAQFFGLDELARTLDEWRAEGDSRRRELMERALPDLDARIRLVGVVQGLLKEETPVREIETILGVFSRPGMESRDVAEIVEAARMELAGGLAGAEPARRRLRLSEEFEAEMKRWVQRSDGGSFFAIPPQETQQLLAAVRVAVTDDGREPVTLVVADETIRPFLRRLIELEFPAIPVLARRELRPELREAIAGEVTYEP